ncbi:hypothetical protein ABGB09_33950 [Streptomyces sp. B8F3]|uniref:hypothetical protein n=1 Tax=Streptomyces sp. B8F3 TaxID=3153573 RepID=UPI00325E118A
MRAPDTLPEAVPLCARLLDHPARLILVPDSHAQVLILVGNVLRAAHLFAPRPVPGLHELRVRVATTSLTPPPLDPGQSALLSDLMGHALSDRGEHTGATDDLRMAAEFYERALAGTPEDVPERAERLNNLGAAHRDIHHLAEEAAELDRAIERFEQAVALGDHTLYANNLAVSLRDRFHRDREPADLDRAVDMFERLTRVATDADHDLPRVLADYSSTLRLRYDLRSAVADLDRAVAVGERAIALGPRGVVRVQALTELGEVLATRAVVRDDEAEFRRGLATLEQARATAEPGSRLRDLAVYKHALAHGPWLTAHETPANLAATVAVLRAALAELPAPMPYRRGLSRLLLMTEPGYARSSGDPGEMTRAIARLEAYEPDGSDEPPSPAEVRVLLAGLYIDRGIASSSPADLGTGIRLATEAADGPALARGRTERFALTRAPDDLERALDSLAHPDVLAESRPYGWTHVVDLIIDVARRHPTLADGRDLVATAIGLVRGRLETPGSLDE